MLTIQEFSKRLIVFSKSALGRLIWTTQNLFGFLIDFNRLELFCSNHKEMPPFNLRSDLNIKKLTCKDLMALTLDTGRFSEQAKLYYARRGIETAYGAYKNGELIHISWVYTATEYSKEPFQRLALKDHEIEIVNCFTLEKYRGSGVYPYMIQFLSNLMIQNGIERIYMMADRKNLASQRGILKAGLKHLGHIVYIRIPATSSKSIYYRRYQNKNI